MTSQTLQKPTIFISSTIYDFRDLRSSLKYYLEELGYIVNMSEFNDFQRNPEENSYTACLNAVKTADYFILLIGSRVGGLYSKTSMTTITQEEYRAAYDNAKEGKTRILAFIRSDVWTVREDRNSLAALLKSEYVTNEELDVDEAEKLSNHSSKFVTDASRIFEFINEVCRINEMKKAVSGDGPLPQANWIHRFETFRDIIDGLRVQLNVAGDLKLKIFVDNLRVELLSNLASISYKSTEGNVNQLADFSAPFRKNYSLKFGETVMAECRHVLWITICSASIAQPQKLLSWRALVQCIDNGIFMGFDTSNGNVIRTNVHDALIKLKINIEQYISCNLSGVFLNLNVKYLDKAKNEGRMEVNSMDFIELVQAANRLDDIYLLSKTIYHHLCGKKVDFANLTLKPVTPFSDQITALEEEKVSIDEIEKILSN